MRRQCLFQRPYATPRCLPTTAARAFSSTPTLPYKKDNRLSDTQMQLAAAASNVTANPSPTTNEEESSSALQMAEDIGILQSTFIRAPFSKLPAPTSWQFYSYFWTYVKSRMSAIYTRSHYKRCVKKKGFVSYLPVDWLESPVLKSRAKRMYKGYYDRLAAYVSSSPLPTPSAFGFPNSKRNEMLTHTTTAATPKPSATSASRPSRNP